MDIIYFYHAGRENQYTPNRSDIACGSCKEGYTLSYAAEYVSVNRYTTGWTVLVVTLAVLYWIVIVIGVFAMVIKSCLLDTCMLLHIIITAWQMYR